jgi:hypothetical protein
MKWETRAESAKARDTPDKGLIFITDHVHHTKQAEHPEQRQWQHKIPKYTYSPYLKFLVEVERLSVLRGIRQLLYFLGCELQSVSLSESQATDDNVRESKAMDDHVRENPKQRALNESSLGGSQGGQPTRTYLPRFLIPSLYSQLCQLPQPK